MTKANIPPAFDFLFDVELDVPPDPFEKFIADSHCAGAHKASSDYSWNEVRRFDAETREATERQSRFAKRFLNVEGFGATAARTDGQALAKSAVNHGVTDDDAWTELVKRSSRMYRENGVIKLFDYDGELIGEKAVKE